MTDFKSDYLDLRLGDCMKGMKEFPDNHFDLAIVDPPYSEHFSTDACANNKGKKGNYKLDTLNGHLPTDLYWKQIKRVSKNQIIWGANWYGRHFGVGGICWFKDNTGNYSPCEYAYQSINNHISHCQIRWNGMLQHDMKNKEHRIHPTQKPVKLYKWLLKNYAESGQKILDTHLGSMSIAIACHDYKCHLTGFEIDEDYFKAGTERVQNHVNQLQLFR